MTQLILIQANFLQKAISALFDLFKDANSSRKEISEARKTIKELNKLTDKDLLISVYVVETSGTLLIIRLTI